MSFLPSLKSKLLQKQVERIVGTRGTKRITQNLHSATSLGLLFDCSQPEEVVTINKFAKHLRAQGKRVFPLGFHNFKTLGEFPFPTYCKKDLNWYGKPKSANVEEFVERDLDILINAFTEASPSLEYVSQVSRVKFRIGFYNEALLQCSEFMVTNSSGGLALQEGLDLMFNYLKNIHGKRA